MKASVVVPAFNEERLIGACLRAVGEALAAFGDAGWRHEVVVCDNNSTDRTAQIAAAAGAKVVFEPVNQISRARNAGAAAATGDWLVFVDADSTPSRALFEEVERAIASGRVLAGGCTVTLALERKDVAAAVGAWNALSRTLKWAAGSFIFCEAAAFREIGGFSEQLFAAEEIDFSRRIKRLARARGRTVEILHRHPLLTSGRKAELYRTRDLLRFMAKTLLSRGGALRRREDCAPWYDGRR